MAAITTIHNQTRTSYFVTYYEEGVKKRLQMVYTLEEAREQKAEYDERFPPTKKYRKHVKNYNPNSRKVLEQKPAPGRCCYRMHEIEGERFHVQGFYYACKRCYEDFTLGGIYKTTKQEPVIDPVAIILQAEGILPEKEEKDWLWVMGL